MPELATKKIVVGDLMTKDVISVTPEMPLVEAVDLLLKHGYNGLPVVDSSGVLVGILTEYDLVIKGSSLHLPTFLKLLEHFEIYKKDSSLVKNEISAILTMKVGDVMSTESLTLSPDDSIDKAIKTFSEHHKVNPILVVNNNKKLVGVLSRYDLIKLFGAPLVKVSDGSKARELDKDINLFLEDFEKRFVLVSKARTYSWFFFSIVFALIGFIIAFALILRIR